MGGRWLELLYPAVRWPRGAALARELGDRAVLNSGGGRRLRSEAGLVLCGGEGRRRYVDAILNPHPCYHLSIFWRWEFLIFVAFCLGATSASIDLLVYFMVEVVFPP